MRYLLFLLLTATAAVAQPTESANTSGGPLAPEQAAFDATFYDLHLTIDPAERTLQGTASIYVRVVHPLDVLVLDLDSALSVEGVSDLVEHGENLVAPLQFEQEEGQVRISLRRTAQPGEQLAVQIGYSGTPRVAPNPPWMGGFTWAQTASGEPWVGVSVQGEGADLWWPVKDHPSDEADSVHVTITVPDGLVAVANGQHRGTTTHANGTTTYRYATTNPINNYGVSMGIAPYVLVEETYQSPLGYEMPVRFWVLPEREDDARRQLPQFLDHLRFLEKTLGPYPFRRDGYSILHTPYLGMEHQSLIAYGDDFSDNEAGFDWLHFHELAHEWFANQLTASDWRDMWVHEGFAEYLEALYAEHLAEQRGEDAHVALQAYLAPMRLRLTNASPVAPTGATDTQSIYFTPDGQFDGDIYFKGAWFLHTLRWVVGDEAVFEGLRLLMHPGGVGHVMRDDPCACRAVGTVDVQRAFEEASGIDLTSLFAVYLRQPILPQLVTEQTGEGLVLRWIVPDGVLTPDEAFEVPVEVEAAGQLFRVAMPGGKGFLPLQSAAAVAIDPHRWLLRQQ